MSEQETKQTTRKNGKTMFHAGMICTWDIYHNRISGSDLKANMIHCGYPQEIVDSVPEVDPISTVKKTTSAFRRGRGKSQDKYKAEVVGENDDRIVVGILKRILTTNGSISKSEAAWEQVDSVEFCKFKEIFDVIGITAEAASLRQAIDKALQGLSGEEVRQYVVDAVIKDCAPLLLRKKGGVVFVPIQHEQSIVMVKKCLAMVGDNRLSVYYITGKSDVTHDVNKAISTQVAALKEQIEGWRDGDRKVRSDAEENFFSKITTMKDNLELYQEAMQSDLSDIGKLIEALKEEAEKILDEQEKADPFDFGEDEDSLDEGPRESEGIIEFQYRIIRQLMSMEQDKRSELLGEISDSFDGYMQYALAKFNEAS